MDEPNASWLLDMTQIVEEADALRAHFGMTRQEALLTLQVAWLGFLAHALTCGQETGEEWKDES